MERYLADISNTINQFRQLCKKTTEMSGETQCNTLVKHLLEKEAVMTKNSMQLIRTRQKKGLLGKVLTSVFGLNDEVYTDIDSLKDNQEELNTSTIELQPLSQLVTAQAGETGENRHRLVSKFIQNYLIIELLLLLLV